MENMGKGKQRNNRLNVRFVLLFSVALMLVVMVTFGMTLSYFGGKSQGYTADFILKAGVHFKENTQGTDYQKLTFDSDVLVPGTVINSSCLMTITSGTADVANTTVNGLLRVAFTLTGDMANFVTLNYSSTEPIYVYKGTTSADMTEANKVARLVQANVDGDTHYYLVGTGVTTISQNTTLYEIPCKTNNGEISYVFDLSFTVSNVSNVDGTTIFDNGFSGNTVEFKADFMVIQSEFYDSTQGLNPLAQTYRNAKPIFNAPQGV